MTKSVLLFAGASLINSSSLHGVALVYEGFDYTDGGFFEPSTGTKNNANTAIDGFSTDGWTAGTKNGVDHKLPGASWGGPTGLIVSGGHVTSGGGLLGNRSRLLDGSLAGAGLLDDSAVLWFSIIVRTDVAFGTEKLGFALSNGDFSSSSQENMDTGVSGIGIFSNNTGPALPAMWTPGALDSTPDSGTPTAINTAGGALIVGKIEWGAALGDETLTLYAPDAALNQGAAVTVNTMPDINQGSLDRISLLVKEGVYIDEIRFGGSYVDVTPSPVPEPSSMALLGLGGLALLRRRR